MASQRCTGVPLDADQGMNVTSLQNKIMTRSRLAEIEGIEDYDVVLEALNQAGNTRGIEFKKGIQKLNKGEPPSERSIICKFADYNREKHLTNKKVLVKKPTKLLFKISIVP